MVEFPSLEGFNRHVNVEIWFTGGPSCAGGQLNSTISEGFPNPNNFFFLYTI